MVTQFSSAEKWLAGRQARLSMLPPTQERCYVCGPIHRDRSGMTFRPTRHYWSIWACQHGRMEARGMFGEKGGRMMRGDSQPGPDAKVGGWLGEAVPLGDSQRSNSSGGY